MQIKANLHPNHWTEPRMTYECPKRAAPFHVDFVS